MIRLIVVLAIGAASCTDDGGPRLQRAEPDSARAGEMVTIYGRKLCAGDCATAAGAVQIGLTLPTIQAPVVTYEDDAAQIVVPASAPVGTTEIVVTVNDRASNAIEFEVLP